MSATNTSPQLELPIVEISTDEVTVLVAPVNPATGHSGSSAIYAGYPIDLDAGSAGVAKQLRGICADEQITVDQLEVVGIEFGDPEQYNTTVTLDRDGLEMIVWNHTDAATGQTTALVHGTPDTMELQNLVDPQGQTSVSVPVYSN